MSNPQSGSCHPARELHISSNVCVSLTNSRPQGNIVLNQCPKGGNGKSWGMCLGYKLSNKKGCISSLNIKETSDCRAGNIASLNVFLSNGSVIAEGSHAVPQR